MNSLVEDEAGMPQMTRPIPLATTGGFMSIPADGRDLNERDESGFMQ